MLKNRRHEDKHALHHQVYAASTTSDPCDGEKRAHSCTQRDHVIRTLCKCKPNMKNTSVYNSCSMSARVSHISTLHDYRYNQSTKCGELDMKAVSMRDVLTRVLRVMTIRGRIDA